MATVTGTTSTFGAVGEREDLTDIIYDISPTETPFMTSVARVNAKGVLHEWQTFALAAASNNAQLEGDDVTFASAAPTSRLGNDLQISRKEVIVSGTLRAVDTAGRNDDLEFQILKKGQELRRDMEVALTQNNAATVGAALSARQLGGLETWLITNQTHLSDTGTTVALVSGKAATAPTDGTQTSAVAEADVKSIIRECWSAGGNPNMILVGPVNKQNISAFSGIAPLQTNIVQNQASNQVTIVAGADLYRSDYGTLRVTPSRFNRDRTISILDTEFWAVAFLRGIQREPLAKTGDADKEMILAEYTLEARNEASSGKIADTSV